MANLGQILGDVVEDTVSTAGLILNTAGQNFAANVDEKAAITERIRTNNEIAVLQAMTNEKRKEQTFKLVHTLVIVFSVIAVAYLGLKVWKSA